MLTVEETLSLCGFAGFLANYEPVLLAEKYVNRAQKILGVLNYRSKKAVRGKKSKIGSSARAGVKS